MGTIAITGTASGSSFDHYELAYSSGPGFSIWVPIGSFTAAVTNGQLGTWNYAGLPLNIYSLRLRVFNQTGSYTDTQTPVIVENPITLIPTTANPYSPVISGNQILWLNAAANNYNNYLYLYDLGTHQQTQITSGNALTYTPSMDGSRIAYADKRNGNMALYVYDLSNQTETALTGSASILLLVR